MAIDQGMDISEVKALAEHLKAAANKFDGIVQLLNARVSSTTWLGADATRFKNDWWPGHRTRLQQLRTDLDGFGQSAMNNATEQEDASAVKVSGGGGGGSVTNPNIGGGISHIPEDDLPNHGQVPGGGSVTVTPAGRTIADVQTSYDEWAAKHPGFGPGGESQYQCTGWANFRWAELGYDGPPITGHGGAMVDNAPGEPSSTPSLHAMASYKSGAYGHVMIVEEVLNGGNQIRVSEMNTGLDRGTPGVWDDADLVATPDEYRDNHIYTRGADGIFRSWNGNPLSFAAFPG